MAADDLSAVLVGKGEMLIYDADKMEEPRGYGSLQDSDETESAEEDEDESTE